MPTKIQSPLCDFPLKELCALIRILVFCKFYFAKGSLEFLADHELEIAVDLTLYMLIVSRLSAIESKQLLQDGKTIDRCLQDLWRKQDLDAISIKQDLDACLDRYLPNISAAR